MPVLGPESNQAKGLACVIGTWGRKSCSSFKQLQVIQNKEGASHETRSSRGCPELSRFKALLGKVGGKSDIFSPEGSGCCVGKGGHQGTMTGGPHSVWGDEEKQGI